MDETPGSGGEQKSSGIGDSIPVRGLALAVLASAATLFLVHWAQPVLVPIALAVFLRYALMPMVTWLRKTTALPESVGAALVLIFIITGIGFGVAALHDQAMDMLDKLPRAARKLESAIRQSATDSSGAVGKLKQAATEIDKAATSAIAPPEEREPVAKVQTSAVPQISAYFWSGSFGLLIGAAQTVVVLALTYFLLIAGDTFRRKIVRISGATMTEKKLTVQILYEIDEQIQRYLFVQIGASALKGVLAWLALALIGLEDAAFWGFVAGVLHLIPYVGPTIIVLLTAIVAYLQFPDIATVLLVPGTLLVIAGLIGFGIVPWLTGKLSHLSPVTVFISLLVWGWLWGIWGLLLGVPIVMALQAVSERVPGLHAFAEILGSDPVIAGPVDNPRVDA